MGFFNKQKDKMPEITPKVLERPIASVIDVESALSTPQIQQPKEEVESFEDWENENEKENTPEEIYQNVESVIKSSNIKSPLIKRNTMSEEEEIELMKAKLAEKEESVRLRKEEEERLKLESENRNQSQTQFRQQQVVYLTEAELLREINKKLDALIMWAANMSGVSEDGRQ